MSIQVSYVQFKNAFEVTPDDSNDLTYPDASLYVGTGGTVTVDFVDGGTNIPLTNVPNGTFLPVRVSRVYSTGTTASAIVAGYTLR